MKNFEKELKAPKEIAWKLDEYQLKATEAPLGNTCVFAVAGSGKTTLLTHRVANLIYHGIPEREILLVTFTNQAAKEMTERISKVLRKEKSFITSGTFHSIANLFLRKFDEKRKQILDEDDAIEVIKNSYNKIIDKDDIYFRKNIPHKKIKNMLSYSINHHIDLDEVAKKKLGRDINVDYINKINKVINQYSIDKANSNLRDFDDLLVDVYLLLKDNPLARKYLTDTYKYIFVDEYQDINWLQYQFLKLMNINNNMFVIGDRAQCIYKFRGSKDEYIEKFDKDFKDVKTYFLQKNYRSVPTILKVAENAINYNKYRYPVKLIPNKEVTLSSVFLDEHANQYEEANNIVWQIQNSISTDEYDQVAILVRANYLTKLFEQELVNRGIPYKVVGALSFYKRAHIKILISLLQFLNNKSNQVAFEKIVTLVDGVGEVTANELYSALKYNYGLSLEDMLRDYNFKKENHKDFISLLVELSDYSTVSTLIELFMKKFFSEYLDKYYEEDAKDRKADITALIEQSDEFEPEEFLDNVSLYYEEPEEKEDTKKVTIMTMHKSKGKEWDYVFLPSLVENIMPMMVSQTDILLNNDDMKSERNLYYVACTRAREKLFLSFFNEFKSFDKKGRVIYKPAFMSMFIKESKGEK